MHHLSELLLRKAELKLLLCIVTQYTVPCCIVDINTAVGSRIAMPDLSGMLLRMAKVR